VREAAVYLGVSVRTVYLWVERKQIPHLRVMGRNTLFLKSDLAPFRAQFRREVVMSRPRNHDGRLFRKEESKFWWMDYRERDGKRQRESTNSEDWEETQKRLRGRLQARDSNTLAMLRKGEQLTFAQGAEHFLEAFSQPPIRTQKTHLSYARVAKHLNARMGEVLLADLTADMIETYLRRRFQERVQITTSEGKVLKGLVKPSTVHQEFRVLRRMFNVAVRKKLLVVNPCAGVEFPVPPKGLFRPHYVTWSEQRKIAAAAPDYLENSGRRWDYDRKYRAVLMH
jgi:excisionase family DNA binding protein